VNAFAIAFLDVLGLRELLRPEQHGRQHHGWLQRSEHAVSGLPPACKDCKTSLDALVTWDGDSVPTGKGALLEYTMDNVFPAFLGIPISEFTMGLDALAMQRIDPLPRFKYFYVQQSSHVLMVHPDLAQNGVRLWDWLPQMLNDDPKWASVHP
jgi:hypothetical protein